MDNEERCFSSMLHNHDFCDEFRLLLESQISLHPHHQAYLRRRFENIDKDEISLLNEISKLILLVHGSQVDRLCNDYDWISNIMLEQELLFRRSGKYPVESVEQAVMKVYSDRDFMERYMNGLLMTQLWWANHTKALGIFKNRFLTVVKSKRVLEIGPGHGFLLAMAAKEGISSLVGLDISSASIEATRASLDKIGGCEDVCLLEGDLLNIDPHIKSLGEFDGIIFSEVLEHLDRPREAMQGLRSVLLPGGVVFLHVPINSPAPDHIFLLKSMKEVIDFCEGCDFNVIESFSIPGANMDIETAINTGSTISAVLI